MEYGNEKKNLNITTEGVPDAIIIVKEGYLGRLVGKKGERVNNIEKDANMKLRAVELSLDFKEMVRTIHPITWIA